MYLPTALALAFALMLVTATTASALPASNDDSFQPETSQAQLDLGILKLSHPELRNHTGLERRDAENNVYGIYECQYKTFKPPCYWHQIDPHKGLCINRKYEIQGGTDGTGSFGPDKDVWCHVFPLPDCKLPDAQTYDVWDFTYPGTGDCANYGPWEWTKGDLYTCPSSFKCGRRRILLWAEDGREGTKQDLMQNPGEPFVDSAPLPSRKQTVP